MKEYLKTTDEVLREQGCTAAGLTSSEVEKRIRAAIADFFKLELGRPEILNRIGENIVVFDFIREEAAKAILSSQVNKIVRRMAEQKNIRITVSEGAYAELLAASTADLSNGGRGIGNQVESLLINPLSRWLFDNEVLADASVTIDHFDVTSRPPALTCHVTEEETNG